MKISKIFTLFIVALFISSCGGGSEPTACDCLKNMGDVEFTKKCNDYKASLSKEEAKKWMEGLKDCK